MRGQKRMPTLANQRGARDGGVGDRQGSVRNKRSLFRVRKVPLTVADRTEVEKCRRNHNRLRFSYQVGA